MADVKNLPNVQQKLSGPEKAAAFILSLKEEIATSILKNLTPKEVQKITNYVAKLESIAPENMVSLKEEFTRVVRRPVSITSSVKDKMIKLLSKTLPKEQVQEVVENMEIGFEKEGLETLKWLDPQTISSFIKSEHPQTIALILAYLEAPQAAEVLGLLPEALQPDVVYRLATLEKISPAIVKELDEVLRTELLTTGTPQSSSVGGVEAVAEIMNQVDKTTETNIFNGLEEINPGLAENIRSLMFVFEDLVLVDTRGMQAIMKEVSNDILTLALKTASDAIKAKIFSSISSRAAVMIKEELELMGPVKLQEVERAQQEIVKIARRLEEEGKIILAGKGGGDVLV